MPESDERREAAIEAAAKAMWDTDPVLSRKSPWGANEGVMREGIRRAGVMIAAYDAALGGEAEKGPQWTLLFDGQRWSVYEVFRAGRLIRAGERGESLVDILKHSHAGNAWHLHTSIVQRSMAAAPNEQEGE